MILKRIKIKTPLNEFTNCYIVQDENTKETMVIDPGGEFEKIQEMLQTINAKVKYKLSNPKAVCNTFIISDLLVLDNNKLLILPRIFTYSLYFLWLIPFN